MKILTYYIKPQTVKTHKFKLTKENVLLVAYIHIKYINMYMMYNLKLILI